MPYNTELHSTNLISSFTFVSLMAASSSSAFFPLHKIPSIHSNSQINHPVSNDVRLCQLQNRQSVNRYRSRRSPHDFTALGWGRVNQHGRLEAIQLRIQLNGSARGYDDIPDLNNARIDVIERRIVLNGSAWGKCIGFKALW
ncbi:hypothetical protein ACP275_02G056800 [Erythranthe tilingii]